MFCRPSSWIHHDPPDHAIWASQNSFFHTIRMIPWQFGHQTCREFSNLMDPNEADWWLFVSFGQMTINFTEQAVFFGPLNLLAKPQNHMCNSFSASRKKIGDSLTASKLSLAFLTTIDRFFWPTLEKKGCNVTVSKVFDISTAADQKS